MHTQPLAAERTPPDLEEERRRRPALAAAVLALVSGAAQAAGRASGEAGADAPDLGIGHLSPADPTLLFSLQPTAQTPAESKPLTIAADRPGFSDSSSIVPAGHFQIETGYNFTFRDHEGIQTQAHDAPEVLARVGLLEDRLELRFSAPDYVWSRSDSGPGFESVAGFSDMSIGFKLKISDQDRGIPRLCFETVTTLSTGSKDISNRDIEPTFKLIGSWDLGGNFSLTSNAVVTYASTSGERFLQGAGSASLSYSATKKLSFFGEYFVVGPHFKGTDAAHSIDGGAAYLLTSRIQLDARAGFGLNQEADNFFAGVGISFLF